MYVELEVQMLASRHKVNIVPFSRSHLSERWSLNHCVVLCCVW